MSVIKRILYLLLTVVVILLIILFSVLIYCYNDVDSFEENKIKSLFQSNITLFEEMKNEITYTVKYAKHINLVLNSEKKLVLYSKTGVRINKYNISEKMNKKVEDFFDKLDLQNCVFVYKFDASNKLEDVNFKIYIPEQRMNLNLVWSSDCDESIKIISDNFKYEKINDYWYIYNELFT